MRDKRDSSDELPPRAGLIYAALVVIMVLMYLIAEGYSAILGD